MGIGFGFTTAKEKGHELWDTQSRCSEQSFAAYQMCGLADSKHTASSVQSKFISPNQPAIIHSIDPNHGWYVFNVCSLLLLTKPPCLSQSWVTINNVGQCKGDDSFFTFLLSPSRAACSPSGAASACVFPDLTNLCSHTNHQPEFSALSMTEYKKQQCFRRGQVYYNMCGQASDVAVTYNPLADAAQELKSQCSGNTTKSPPSLVKPIQTNTTLSVTYGRLQ